MALTLTRAAVIAVAAISIITAMSEPLWAQAEEARTVTVRTRERPELDALGVRFGSFTLYSAIELQSEYDDNIYASNGLNAANAEESDFIIRASPEFRLQSNWSRHNLLLFGSMDYRYFTDNTDESHLDWRIGGEGRVDVRRDTHFGGGLEFQQGHEARSSVNDQRSAEPIAYHQLAVKGNFLRRLNRLSAKIDGAFDYHNFFDGIDSFGTPGAQLDLDGRDRVAYRAEVRLGYELQESYEAFVTAHYGLTDYILAQDPLFLVNRDSQSYGYSAGIRLEFTGIMFGDFYGGQFFHEYDDGTLRDFARDHYGVRVTWNISRLSTLIFELEESAKETTVPGASASLDTTYRGQLDHELLRNAVVGLSAVHTKSEYPGESANREDNILKVAANIKYMLNRGLYITFEYEYLDRGSSLSTAEFTSNSAMLRIRLQK